MTIRRIDNSMWGFETNCFVCEQSNEHGLQLKFFHDTEIESVFAHFSFSDTYSGAPTFVHGGLQLAVLDEAMAWSTIAVASRWAVTASFSSRFKAPVRVGETYRVDAGLTERSEKRITTWGRIVDVHGAVTTEAEAEFAVLSEAQAVDATGGEVADGDADFFRKLGS